MLVVVAVLDAVSMRLAWHRRVVPGDGLRLVRGIESANWLIVVAALAFLFAMRFFWSTPGTLARWLMMITAFAIVMGMYADYVDWGDRAAQLNVQAYYGPGFFVGLAAAAMFISVTVLAWRFRDG
jgi:hypothetical protein